MGKGRLILYHIGMTSDTGRMEFTAAKVKLEKINILFRAILFEVMAGKRWVTRRNFAPLCRVSVSTIRAIPLA